jgi:hypothetical protein
MLIEASNVYAAEEFITWHTKKIAVYKKEVKRNTNY